MKRNKLYVVDKYNRHLFDNGGFTGNPLNFKNAFSGKNLMAGLINGAAGALASGIGSAVGNIGGSLIGGGLQSGAGSTISGIGSTIGGAVGMVNPLAGAAISAASGVLGGLTNRAFGTKVDQEKLNAINAGINQNMNFVSNAGSFDDIKGPASVLTNTNAYSGGWFSGGKARRKNQRLKEQLLAATSFANRSVDNNIYNLQDDQLNDALANFAAFGGPLHSYGADWSDGLTFINSGGTHEQNPFDGVQMGVAPDGTPNLVEEGEVVYNDYVFSNRIKVPQTIKDKYKIKGSDDITFAELVRKLSKNNEERPNDPIAKRTLEDTMANLRIEQEAIREKKATRKNKFAKGGPMGIIFDGEGNLPNYLNFLQDMGMTFNDPSLSILNNFMKSENDIAYEKAIAPRKVTTKEPFIKPKEFDIGPETFRHTPYRTKVEKEGSTTKSKFNPLTALRYAPALGAGIGVFTDLMGWTNKPDYSPADNIMKAANSVRDVQYKPIGDYLTYRPFDRLFYANQLGAQSAGLRRSIVNSSVNRGQAIAGLLAADYNAQNQLSNLFRQAEEYNLGQRAKVAEFNRATNMFNSEADLKAQIANREIAQARIKGAYQAAALREAIDNRVGAARSANLTNLFDSLGNIGREEVSKSWINKNPAFKYAIGLGGQGVNYKELGYAYDPITGKKLAKNGGYLTIKSKKRRK